MQRLLLILALLVTGCASNPPAVQFVTRPAESGLSSFSLSGRIAVNNDKDRSFIGIHWSHRSSEEDEIMLIAPLGQTVARISRSVGIVELDTPDKQYFAEDAEALTKKILGWSLPLEGLIYWVQALPEPDIDADIKHDEKNRISLLKQDGWEIHYTKYAAQTADSLPLRMSLQREKLGIDLLIDSWETQ